jgi:hypothetical protein
LLASVPRAAGVVGVAVLTASFSGPAMISS